MKLRSLWLASLILGAWTILAGCHDKETVPTPLTITSFSPATGAPGASVTINGTGFGNEASANAVKFNGETASITHASSTELTVTVPENATTGKVTVTVGDRTVTTTTDFTVNPLAPVISSISPEKGAANTEVTVTGLRFFEGAKVYFGGVQATDVTIVNKTTIKVKVPAEALNGKVKVVTGELEGVSSATFLTAPRISSISVMEGIEGAEITIAGANFGATKTDNTISFGTGAAVADEILEQSPAQIKVKAPVAGTNGKISITAAGFTVESTGSFNYKPNIIDFNPKYGKRGTTVTLTGTRFSDNPLVKLNEITAVIKTKSSTAIEFTIPNNSAVTGDKITMLGNGTTQTKDEFVVTNIWKKLNDGASVNVALTSTSTFVWDNKIYFGLGAEGSGYSKTFRIYDPATNAWTTGPSLHSSAVGREGAYCVRRGDRIYIGMGEGISSGALTYLYDWWSYDPTKTGDNAWVKLKDYPASGTNYPGYGTAFVLNDRIYAGFGVNSSLLMEYLPATNEWSSNISTYSGPRLHPVAFVVNNKVYIGGGIKYNAANFEFYSYNPASADPNATIANYPGTQQYMTNPSFIYNGDPYVMDGYFLIRFNKGTEDWTKIDDYSAAPLVLEQTQVVNNRIFGIKKDHSVYEYIPAR